MLSAEFAEHYVESAVGRTVRARLVHDDPPVAAADVAWPVRFTDCDVLGHVNNANYWNPVEEHLAARRDLRAPLRAELEYRTPVDLEAVGVGGSVTVRTADHGRGFGQWWCTGDTVHASALVLGFPEDRSAEDGLAENGATT